MRGFSCFLKFLVVAFISQGTAFLLASEPEGGGGVVVEVPRDARSGSPTSIMDNEYPGGQFPLEPLVLPTSSSSSRLPAIPYKLQHSRDSYSHSFKNHRRLC